MGVRNLIGIVVITHGQLCTELVETAEGMGIKSRNITTVPFFQNEGLDDLKIKISKAIEKIDKGDGVVLLTDLLYGSCSKVAGEFLEQEGLEVICGVNLPMLISLITHQDENLNKVVEKAKESARQNIVSLKQILKESSK